MKYVSGDIITRAYNEAESVINSLDYNVCVKLLDNHGTIEVNRTSCYTPRISPRLPFIIESVLKGLL